MESRSLTIGIIFCGFENSLLFWVVLGQCGFLPQPSSQNLTNSRAKLLILAVAKIRIAMNHFGVATNGSSGLHSCYHCRHIVNTVHYMALTRKRRFKPTSTTIIAITFFYLSRPKCLGFFAAFTGDGDFFNWFFVCH
jgi:hypothetical protein